MRRTKRVTHRLGLAAGAACLVLAGSWCRGHGRNTSWSRVFRPSRDGGSSQGPTSSVVGPQLVIPNALVPSRVIFMRPHVFGAKGDAQDRKFVPLVIRAVLQFNPTAHVYMMHNDPAFTLPDQPRFHGLLMADYGTPAIRQFKATFVHLSTNAAPYEIASTLAYFYVASLMDAMALQRVVVVETGVLVFCDLWAKLGQHWDLDAVDAILTKRRVMAASYVTRTYLETFVNLALDFYRDDAILTELRESVRKSAGSRGGITDMTVNAWLAKPAFARRNAANHTVRIDELSRLIDGAEDGAAYFDSNIRTANYSFGAFTMETAAGLGPVKKLYKDGLGGAPRGRLNGRPVGLWGLHFQGGTKELIPGVLERFVAGQEEGKGLHLSRLHYILHGHADQAALEAASPARAAAALGVAAASPVAGPGTADPDALRTKGRLLSLNASICAAGQANVSTEIKRQVGADSPVERQGALADYVADACAVAPPASAAYVVGDVTTCFSRPVFTKARPCGCNTSVLLNLNRGRHFGFDPAALDAEDVPWADKLPVAIWRGAATGTINDRRQAGRYHLLTRWAHSLDPRVDVGMTALPMSTGNASRDAALKATAKPSVGRSSMLRHRYLISAEGYDVATNLKWALWSASAVIMPRPTVCSWLMEDRLVPWVQYVPVAPDFSNLTDAVEWCEGVGNAGVCQRIGAAGRAYMEEHGFIGVEVDWAVGRAVAAAAVADIGR